MNNATLGGCGPACVCKTRRVSMCARQCVWEESLPQPPTSRCLQHEVSELAGKRGESEEERKREPRSRGAGGRMYPEKIWGGGICRAEEVKPIDGNHAESKDQTDQERYSTLHLYFICHLSGAASHTHTHTHSTCFDLTASLLQMLSSHWLDLLLIL